MATASLRADSACANARRNPAYLALEVSAFLRRTDIAPSRLGRDAVNDPALVTDLFNGRIVRPATAAKVREHIARLEGC